jgi:hypothetical protein
MASFRRPEVVNSVFLFLLAVLITAFAAIRPVGFDRDSLQYKSLVESIELGVGGAEPGFNGLVALLAEFGTDTTRLLLITIAIFSIPLKLYAIFRLSNYSLIPIFAYVAIYYPLHDLTQIRTGIAAVFFLWSVRDLLHRKHLRYAVKILAATLFHYSSLVLLLLVFVDPTTRRFWPYWVLLFISLILMMYPEKAVATFVAMANLGPGFISSKVNRYFELMSLLGMHSKINSFDLYHIIQLGLLFSAYIYKSKFLVSDQEVLIYKIMMISLISYFGFSFFPVVAVRISEYLAIVFVLLLGSMVNKVRPKVISAIAALLFFSVMASTYWIIKDDFFNYSVL